MKTRTINDSDLATDVQAQITASITEDYKFISRLKLFNWWVWMVQFVVQTQTKTASGTGALTTINIAHGLGYTPVIISVHPNNAASNVQPLVTSDATNFIFNYAVAPATGTNNLSYNISYRR